MRLEQEVQVNIAFSELQCFDTEDVASCISKETALNICRNSLENLSAKTVEVLSLWLRKLLRAYISQADCCIDVLQCLYEWLLRLKDEVTPGNETACSQFVTVLVDAVVFAEWAKVTLLKTGERLVHTTSFFLLSIVYSCLQLSNDNNVQALKEHEPKAIELHLNVLYLMQEITSKATNVHARIMPLIRQLIEIADFLGVNIKYLHAFVKTSNTLTNICTHYATCVSLGQTKETQGMPDWLQDTVLHLCDTVLNHLETVYQEESLAVPVDKMEEYLKVTQAYLIMLHKMLGIGAKRWDKTVSDAIMLLLSGGENKPRRDLGQNIPKLLAKYVRPYIMEIYALIYQLQDFQRHLVACLVNPEPADEDYFELCIDYITTTIIDHTEIEQLTFQTVQKIFEYLFTDACNFTNATRYNRLLEVFGSLLHVACSLELMNYFCAILFQEDIIKSQACADILMLCFRLEETNPGWNKNDVTAATSYWIKCNNSYAMFSQNLNQLHIQRMLKYFHRLGDQTLPIFNLRNYRYLHCVAAKAEQQKRVWLLRLQRIVMEPLNDIEQYYEILALMQLLSAGELEWLPQLSGYIKKMMLNDKCKLLTNTYFKLASQASPATKLRILQAITNVATNSCCWQMQKFLHTCKRSDDAQLKSLAEQHTITTELLPLLDAPFHKPTSDQLLKTNYKLTYRRQQAHKCNLGCLKRKRLQSEPKELIRQLEQDSEQLLQCSAELTAADVGQLRNIVVNLNHILSQF